MFLPKIALKIFKKCSKYYTKVVSIQFQILLVHMSLQRSLKVLVHFNIISLQSNLGPVFKKIAIKKLMLIFKKCKQKIKSSVYINFVQNFKFHCNAEMLKYFAFIWVIYVKDTDLGTEGDRGLF